jgi:hypothetical protein
LLPRQPVEAIGPAVLVNDVPLERHAQLLHDPSGRGVLGVMYGNDALELEPVERLVTDRAPGLGCIPVALR